MASSNSITEYSVVIDEDVDEFDIKGKVILTILIFRGYKSIRLHLETWNFEIQFLELKCWKSVSNCVFGKREIFNSRISNLGKKIKP